MKGVSQQVAHQRSLKRHDHSPRSPRTVSVPYRNLPEWIARARHFDDDSANPSDDDTSRYFDPSCSNSIICRSQCFETKPRRAKCRKTNTWKAAVARNRVTRAPTSLSALLDVFQHGLTHRTARGTGNNGRTEGRSENRDQSEGGGRGYSQSTSRRDRVCGPGPPMSPFSYVFYASVLGCGAYIRIRVLRLYGMSG